MAEEPKAKWTWGDYYLAAIGGSVLLIFVWAGMGKLGIVEPFERAPVVAERPRWDNKACLRDAAFRIRSNDPMIGDEDLNGLVARECARKQSEFYGW